MPDLVALQQTEIAGASAHGGWSRSARLCIRVAALLAFVLATAPAPVRAVSVLSNASATPSSGTTATSFVFTVDYDYSSPVDEVWAEVGSVTIPLARIAGGTRHGTWQATSRLPVGSWQVTFFATISEGTTADPLGGPTLTVTQAPTPRPTPTPTPRPTATPRPAPPPTPPPPGVTPAPAAPEPQPTPTPRDRDDDEGSTDAASPSASVRSSGSSSLHRSADPSTTIDESVDPSGSPDASAAPDNSDGSGGSLLAPFLIVGGTMSIAGAAVLGRQWYVTHSARPH